MKELATLKVEELPDGRIALTWDENDPACAFLNGKSEAEIITMIENGLEMIIQEEEEAKQAGLKALEQLAEHDQKMGFY